MEKEWFFVLMLFRGQRDGLEFGSIEAFDPYKQFWCVEDGRLVGVN